MIINLKNINMKKLNVIFISLFIIGSLIVLWGIFRKLDEASFQTLLFIGLLLEISAITGWIVNKAKKK